MSGFSTPSGGGAAGSTANFLATITPSFSSWTTNPGTNANIVNELGVNLTTSGVTPGSVECYITYNFPVLTRVLVRCVWNIATANPFYIQATPDGSTWSDTMIGGSIQSGDVTTVVYTKGLRVRVYRVTTPQTVYKISLLAYQV